MEVFAPGNRGYLALSVLLVGIMFLTACGGGSSATGGTGSQNNSQTSAPTVSMNASATQIVAGSSSPLTLTVTASNTTQVVIYDTCDNQTYTLQTTCGTQTQPIPVPTTPGTCTYTATASGANSQTTTSSVTITVKPSTATTVSMTPAQQTIAAGQSATLQVTVANASSVYITNNVTSASVSVAAAGGTVKVTPTQTTTYTVTATGANNQQSTATATVTILSVSVTASPTTIVKGNPTNLSVTAANASQVVISDNIDSTTYTLSGSGTQAASPAVTTIYTATATGGGATATATVTVTVNASASTALINHVIFLLQENRTFDTYFGMLNKYRASGNPSGKAWNIGDDGTEYDVDGLADTSGVMATNFTANTSDPVTCPASLTWEGTTCVAGTVIYPATTFPLFRFASACIDDMTSDWLGSYGDVSTYNFTTSRNILKGMDGFVHVAQNYAESCNNPTNPALPYCGSGALNHDFQGKRAMGYYDESFLNYYYYMASQFALSDRWFSPISSKSTPNRIATLTGGTTQGLVYDPFKDDNVGTQLTIPTIFSKLDKAGVSWKIYYGITQSGCTDPDGDCGTSKLSAYPAITFADFTDSYKYLYVPATKGSCLAPTVPSLQAVADAQNAFCIDPTHIAPISQFFTDVANGTLPSFAYVEPAYGIDDEHPGSGQSILSGQAQVAKMANALMATAGTATDSWNDSVFFVSYDEGGGPFDHVPPVPNHTNDFTSPALAKVITTDISSIAVNPDKYLPCPAPIDPTTLAQTPSLHCDLLSRGSFDDPGYKTGDAAQVDGFAAQLGFRLPNMVISPFTRRHYVSHIPMDHTAILRFVEDRFINDGNYLTLRDAAQPNLLDFFDFVNIPWAVPPTQNTTTVPPPTPVAPSGATCTPASM